MDGFRKVAKEAKENLTAKEIWEHTAAKIQIPLPLGKLTLSYEHRNFVAPVLDEFLICLLSEILNSSAKDRRFVFFQTVSRILCGLNELGQRNKHRTYKPVDNIMEAIRYAERHYLEVD